MDKSIFDICVLHHSPRFKPWAMKQNPIQKTVSLTPDEIKIIEGNG